MLSLIDAGQSGLDAAMRLFDQLGEDPTLSVPLDAVLAIYSKENGQGMMFAQDDEPLTPTDPDASANKLANRSHLTIVK